MDQVFGTPVFPKFEAPSEGGLPYMMDTCREGPRPISLHVEKTPNFDQVLPQRPFRPKWTKHLIRLLSPNLKPLE